MKNLLRKWLEVPEVPEVPDMSNYVKKDDVKEAVEDAIVEAFQTEATCVSLFWHRDQHKDIRGTLSKCVAKMIKPSANTAVVAKVNELLEPESFIDDVVERIKNKQLST